MSRLRSLVSVLALAAGLGLGVPATFAITAASAGTYQYFGAESYNSGSGATAFVQFNAAHSQYIVSIESGYVHCPAFNGGHVTWCGTIGNNTDHAQAGVNYTVSGRAYYLREDVYAPVVYGGLTCSTRGNATSHFVTACGS
jgi:hypothetical protein